MKPLTNEAVAKKDSALACYKKWAKAPYTKVEKERLEKDPYFERTKMAYLAGYKDGAKRFLKQSGGKGK